MLRTAMFALPVLLAAVPALTYSYVQPVNKPATLAPLRKVDNAIANSYIVTFKDDVPPDAMLAHTSFINSLRVDNTAFPKGQSGGIQTIFDTAIQGYHGYFDEETLALIRSRPETAAVEQDQMVWASKVQNGAPWGLARISHRSNSTEGALHEYLYDEKGGEGVDVYVIDTGINTNHVSFEGRASWGYTKSRNEDDSDNAGHGTHCAGIIASRDYGVAKKANLIAVKVLNSEGRGSMSDIVSGVEWTIKNAVQKSEDAKAEYARTGRPPAHKGSVVNMSLGGGRSVVLNAAVDTAVRRGLHMAVAAGNFDEDACNYSPASASEPITVGASNVGDRRAYFSNWGRCLDVFAPGVRITSAWNTGIDSAEILSGTSMASPHVAGLIAYMLSLYPAQDFAPMTEEQPTLLTSLTTFSAGSLVMQVISYFASPFATSKSVAPIPSAVSPSDLKKMIIELSSKDLLFDVGEESPNLLVFNNYVKDKIISKEFWAAL